MNTLSSVTNSKSTCLRPSGRTLTETTMMRKPRCWQQCKNITVLSKIKSIKTTWTALEGCFKCTALAPHSIMSLKSSMPILRTTRSPTKLTSFIWAELNQKTQETPVTRGNQFKNCGIIKMKSFKLTHPKSTVPMLNMAANVLSARICWALTWQCATPTMSLRLLLLLQSLVPQKSKLILATGLKLLSPNLWLNKWQKRTKSYSQCLPARRNQFRAPSNSR